MFWRCMAMTALKWSQDPKLESYGHPNEIKLKIEI